MQDGERLQTAARPQRHIAVDIGYTQCATTRDAALTWERVLTTLASKLQNDVNSNVPYMGGLLGPGDESMDTLSLGEDLTGLSTNPSMHRG